MQELKKTEDSNIFICIRYYLMYVRTDVLPGGLRYLLVVIEHTPHHGASWHLVQGKHIQQCRLTRAGGADYPYQGSRVDCAAGALDDGALHPKHQL